MCTWTKPEYVWETGTYLELHPSFGCSPRSVLILSITHENRVVKLDNNAYQPLDKTCIYLGPLPEVPKDWWVE